MSGAARFLTTLGRGVAALHLYPGGHPARAATIDESFSALNALLREDPRPTFTFLDSAVLYGKHRLAEAHGWSGAERLVEAGMQRLEFEWPVPKPEFVAFLEEAAGLADPADVIDISRHPSIRYGMAVLPDTDVFDGLDAEGLREIEHTLSAEIEAMDFVLDEAGSERGIQRIEVESIVSSLMMTVASSGAFLVPLVRLREADQYTTTHSLNVAALSMALAEYAGYPREQIRTLGIAGVLHDIGKVRIPRAVLNKKGPLTPEERELMNQHPVDGARIILETGGADLEIAAVVAYEHHIRYDGGGYPTPRQPRACHPASELLHVCDVYDALATHRPYRAAWPVGKILNLIRENAGTEFAPGAARAMLTMMQETESRFHVFADEPARAGGVYSS